MSVRLTQVLGSAHREPVTSELWVAAAFLGGLRTASNADTRTSAQNRGSLKNLLNDLQGVAGELIALQFLERELADWQVAPALAWDGGGGAMASSRCDLQLNRPTREVSVRTLRGVSASTDTSPELRVDCEAKCHLHLTPAVLEAESGLRPKRDLAVNKQAVRDSYALGARGMIPVLTGPGAAVALVGRMEFIEDVLDWVTVDYGYGHLALAVPLVEIAEHAWSAPWEQLSRELESAEQVAGLEP